MKKNAWSILLFVASFLATYAVLCLLLTGAKMALEATWFDYFRVSVTYMALLKTVISLMVAFGVCAVSRLMDKKKR